MTTDRRRALAAGLLYLVTHVTSVSAVVAYRAGTTPGGIAAGGAGDVRLGVLLELVLALAVVGTGVALLPLLHPHGAALAHAFSALRTVEGAVIVAGCLPMLALVGLSDGALGGGSSLLAVHDASFLLGQGLVIGVNTLVIGTLVWRSGVVLRWIGLLALVGGVLVLVSDVGQLFGVVERDGALAMVCAVPVFAFELWFAGYLILRGTRPGSPRRADAPAPDGRSEPLIGRVAARS